MITQRIYIQNDRDNNWQFALQEGAALLQKGEVVAFPTETVYGLGANAWDEKACAKIFTVKGRPADNPLIVHVASVEEAKKIVKKWPREAEICAEKFWPGPLTLVLPKVAALPGIISGELNTVAIRMPRHPFALALIAAASCPVAAPSANLSGKPSPTEGEHVWHDLHGKIPLLIDGGKCAVGLESTVLDLSGAVPVILRPGGVTPEQLRDALGRVEISDAITGGRKEALLPEVRFPRSPGMKYRHYAPRGEIKLACGTAKKKAAKISLWLKNNQENKKTGLLCFTETAELLTAETREQCAFFFSLGSADRPEEAAAKLFEGLRLCDEKNIDLIIAEGIEEKGIGLAFMNRLRKAAGEKGDTEIP